MRRILLPALASVAAAALAAPAMANDHRLKITGITFAGPSQSVTLKDSVAEPFPSPPYRLVVFDAKGNRLVAQNLRSGGLKTGGTNPYVVGPGGNEPLIVKLPSDSGQVCYARGPSEMRIHCASYGAVANPLSGEQGRTSFGPGTGKTFNGDGRANVIVGTPGDDVINCGGGNDRVNGKGGNDVIRCGSGRDRIKGGSGRDRISGGSGADRIFGGSGRDRIQGNSGNDRLFGGADADRLNGGKGRDRIFGGAGNDIMNGGPGRDFLKGGPGFDITVRK